MLSALFAVCEGFAESVTWTVKSQVPAAEGVPEMTPVLPLTDRPAGSEPPEIDQANGDVPPEADSAAEYETFTVPPGSDDVVIDSGAGCTVRPVLPGMPFNVAEMVVLPTNIPVARPPLVMPATPGLEDAHAAWPVRFCVLPSE